MKTKKLIRFDWALKNILRNKANFDVLEGFLSNLLKEEITLDGFMDSESNQEEARRKFNRVDLLCRDSQQRCIIIEIQNRREADYLQRILWGTSKTVVESLELGEEYSNVVKVISISILYYPFHHDEMQNEDFLYYGVTEMTGLHTGKPLILHGSKINEKKSFPVTSKNIFPEYYMIYVEKFEDMIRETIDEWIYFFKHGAIREDFTSPGILLAARKLDYLAMQKEERQAYDAYLAYLGEEKGIIRTAKEEGKTEGVIKGKAEGVIEGREKGIKESKEKIAKNLLTSGMSVEEIARITELSIEDINNLQ